MWYKKGTILLSFLFIVSIVLVFNVTAQTKGIDNLEETLQMTIADIIMIIISGGIIVLIAFDARIALMLAFLLYASMFILFTLLTEEGFSNFNPYYSGVAMMLCFVLICLSLLITYKKSNTPYNVV